MPATCNKISYKNKIKFSLEHEQSTLRQCICENKVLSDEITGGHVAWPGHFVNPHISEKAVNPLLVPNFGFTNCPKPFFELNTWCQLDVKCEKRKWVTGGKME